MCGIFGLVTAPSAPYETELLWRSLEHLAKRSQSRGKDSSGLLFMNQADSVCKVIKGDLRIGSLLSSPTAKQAIDEALDAYAAVDDDVPFIAAGHSRLVTNGSQLDDDNNQPTVRDGLVAIHNGIIVNDAELWAAHEDLERRYSIDTEVLLALLRRQLDGGMQLPEAIAEVDRLVEGTVSTALFHPDGNHLLLATDNGSLYTLTNSKDLLFFASEYFPLASLARRINIDIERDFALRQLPSRNGLLVNLANFNLERFTFADASSTASGNQPSGNWTIAVEGIEGNEPERELVRDVALIAQAADASRFEKMLERNVEKIGKLKRCTRCVLPETFPFIEFDNDGVCNYCRNYKIRNQPKPLDELDALLEPYRRKDGKPDCIVPFSGGRDSTYALHVIKTQLDMNPIAYTYDWGMVTDLGRRNIARVCGKLGVENIIVAANIHWKRDNIRKNIEAWLRKPHLGMIPLFMAGDKYFYYYVDQVKRQTGISLNIWGVNPMENTDFKVGFLGVAPDHDKEYIYSLSLFRQLKLFWGAGKAALSNPAYFNSSILDTLGSFAARSLKTHRDYYHLYDYLLWEESEVDSVLLDEYNWEKAVDTDTTWRIGDGTAAFYNYIYYTVAGFSEHDTFRSNQIREGMLDRDTALKLVETENRPRYPTIRWYTDAVHVDYEHAIRTINAIPKLYR
ncbi:MAG: hypothetical protein QNJ00_13430 [Woeseiaceae bacterium]|nr:hypothetical protein [Woeseiaceae bacterium]